MVIKAKVILAKTNKEVYMKLKSIFTAKETTRKDRIQNERKEKVIRANMY